MSWDLKAYFRATWIVQCLGIVLILLNLLLFYGIFISPQGILGYRQQCRYVEDVEQKTRKLREDNQRLFRRIQNYKNDPQAQERVIREQLGWVREHELMIEFAPNKSAP